MVGKGRRFRKKGFLKKLAGIEGYFLADIESFPNVQIWRVPAKQVGTWYLGGKLGKESKVSRKKALGMLDELYRPATR